MGCFHSCILSITLLPLPSSHVYCISLVLIFADKFLLCGPLPSLWTLHQSTPRSALQMSSPWFHHASVPFQLSVDIQHMLCVLTIKVWLQVVDNPDLLPSYSPFFSILQLFYHLTQSNLSHSLYSSATRSHKPSGPSPASEMSALISHIG